MKLERMTLPFELKKMDEADPNYFYFEGYLSTFGNEDFGRDVIHKGAFKKSLKAWSAKGMFVPTLWQHEMEDPIGVFTEMKEDDVGLFVKCKLPRKDTLVSGRIIPQVEVGSVRTMSIGYMAKSYDFTEGKNGTVRNLYEVDLFEGSLVTMPMNDRAVVTGFKSIASFKALPIADRNQPWDAKAALTRIEAAGKSAEAHLWTHEDGNKFLIADMIGGKLTVVPKALALAAAQIQVGDEDIPAEAVPALKEMVASHYREMKSDSPYAEKDCVRVDFIEQLTPRELERLLRKGVSFSQAEAKRIVKLVGEAQREVEAKSGWDDQDWKDLLAAMKN